MKEIAKGLVIASMCGAIAYGVYVTKSANPLWALFFVVFVVDVLFGNKKS